LHRALAVRRQPTKSARAERPRPELDTLEVTVRKILTLVLAAGLFAALPPSHSQQARSARDLAGFRSAIAHAGSVPAPGIDPKAHE
jgi:hypothetical protein